MIGRGRKKEVNFELSLIPFIDILSVCICFLLVSAVWVHVGALTAAQSIGGQAEKSEKTPTVWARFQSNGKVSIQLRNASRGNGSYLIKARRGKVNWKRFENYIGRLAAKHPKLQTGIIIPRKSTGYKDIIAMMDGFKKLGIKDVGVSPL